MRHGGKTRRQAQGGREKGVLRLWRGRDAERLLSEYSHFKSLARDEQALGLKRWSDETRSLPNTIGDQVETKQRRSTVASSGHVRRSAGDGDSEPRLTRILLFLSATPALLCLTLP